jgi:hypothetical protein
MTDMTTLHDVGPPVVRQSVVVEPVGQSAEGGPEVIVRHTIWYEGGIEEEKEIPFDSLSDALQYAHGICGSESREEPVN